MGNQIERQIEVEIELFEIVHCLLFGLFVREPYLT